MGLGLGFRVEGSGVKGYLALYLRAVVLDLEGLEFGYRVRI